MADELIDIVDESNNLLGVRKMKSEAFKKKLWHRASFVWIYNSKGEMLLQLRAKEKKIHPNMWDVAVAGHLGAGEEPLSAAIRETKEELGIDVSEADLKFIKVAKVLDYPWEEMDNEFQYFYLIKFDGDPKKLVLQKEEVQKVKFFKLDDLKHELVSSKEKYVDYGEYWSKMISEIKKRAKLFN